MQAKRNNNSTLNAFTATATIVMITWAVVMAGGKMLWTWPGKKALTVNRINQNGPESSKPGFMVGRISEENPPFSISKSYREPEEAREAVPT